MVMIPPVLILLSISVRLILHPTQAIASSGVALTSPEALTDTRAMGAMTLTVAVVIAACIFSRTRLRMGHGTVVALMGFILAVRMFGFGVDGTTLAMGDQRVKVIGEAVFLGLNAIAFVLQSQSGAKKAGGAG
jgi:hypothetical protein